MEASRSALVPESLQREPTAVGVQTCRGGTTIDSGDIWLTPRCLQASYRRRGRNWVMQIAADTATADTLSDAGRAGRGIGIGAACPSTPSAPLPLIQVLLPHLRGC